jgi:hypothetical protein
MREVLLLSLLMVACGSSTDDEDNSKCPDLTGTWTVTEHCDASLVGRSAVLSASGCSLQFAAPFDGFSAAVKEDGKISVSGPQTCSGDVNANTISLSCTPGTCDVTLTR